MEPSKVSLKAIYREAMDEILLDDEAPLNLGWENILAGNQSCFERHDLNVLFWESHETPPPQDLVNQLVGQVYGFGMIVNYKDNQWLVSEIDDVESSLQIGEIFPEGVKLAHLGIVRLDLVGVDIDFKGEEL